MTFRITGLAPDPFRALFGLDDDALALHGAIRYRVDSEFGFPDRIELRDATPGDTVLLVNHVHQPADTPFRASHAIFVREGATTLFDAIDTVPDVLRRRMLSLRAFDAAHMMVDAALVHGREADAAIARLFTSPAIEYLHAHYATRGCYAARVDRSG